VGIELEANAVVLGRFRLDRLLGEGGMGVVWAATNTVTLKPTALKFLKSAHAADPRVRQRFLREARAACAVRHPNVVEIHDVLELEDGAPVMVMDLLEGETLGHRLDREQSIPLDQLAAILLPVVSAVGTAHAHGVVHRDLKPDNIFLVRNSDGSQTVCVLDFGIAKMTHTDGSAAETGGLTGTGAMLGTPYYMSPEQIFGERDIDHRTDIWALGVILYECLSGARPTQADNIGQILKIVTTDGIRPLETVAPWVPADVAQLVGRMLSRDRALRPSSLREVRAVLEPYGDVLVNTFGDPIAPQNDLSMSTTGSGRRRVATGDQHVNPLAATRDATAQPPPERSSGGAISPAASTMPLQTSDSLVLSIGDRKKKKPTALFAIVGVAAVVAMGLVGWKATRGQGSAASMATASSIPTAASASTSIPTATSASTPPTTEPLTSTDAATPSSSARAHGKGPLLPFVPPVASVVPPKASAAASGTAKPPATAVIPGGVVDRPPF
jgi:eukaryotic-like serine/threonine-protein kinase